MRLRGVTAVFGVAFLGLAVSQAGQAATAWERYAPVLTPDGPITVRVARAGAKLKVTATFPPSQKGVLSIPGRGTKPLLSGVPAVL